MAYAPSAIVDARRHLRRLVGRGAAVVVVACPGLSGCSDPAEESARSIARTANGLPATGTDRPTGVFADITQLSGIAFTHEPGARGGFRMEEIMGPGCCMLDVDDDGRLDLYLVNGDRAAGARDALYRQMPDGRFEDATATSGLRPSGYGGGCVAADVDDDGDVDLYLMNYGPDELWLNDGTGSFTDATAVSGLDNDEWSVSGAFLDYDRDGDLDLYVAGYLRHVRSRACVDATGESDYCSPHHFKPAPDHLFRNEGGARFRDVTDDAGIDTRTGPGLGVVCDDFDGDGWCDIYVANDQTPNLLWLNGRDGTFVDHAAGLGCAYNADGAAEAGMGIALGDADGDGRLDLFITHFGGETNTLYRRMPEGGFDDRSFESGLAAPSLHFTGFGTGFLDIEHDGDLDALVCNGAVNRRTRVLGERGLGRWSAYAEPNQVFVNDGGGRFTSRPLDPFARPIEVSRGLALGDVDGDGDVDVLQMNTGGVARLFRNDADKTGSWLRVRAVNASGRDAIGAGVTVRAGDRSWRRVILAGSGYAGCDEPVAHFGLGPVGRVDQILVTWPDGTDEVFDGIRANRLVRLERGTSGAGADG